MHSIYFSHTYFKLEGIVAKNEYGNGVAKLIQVLPVKLEELSKDFIDYDTDSGTYKLPSKGDYLLLIFQKSATNIFTTLRRSTPSKKEYYTNNIGNCFEIIIKEEKVN